MKIEVMRQKKFHEEAQLQKKAAFKRKMLRSKGISTRQILAYDAKEDDSIFDFNEDQEVREISIFDPIKINGVKVDKLPKHKEYINT